jgi:anthranilate phosphoribosyltransferase
MLKHFLEQLIAGQDLSAEQCQEALELMLSGADSTQIAAFLVLLQVKPVSATELYGFVLAMRSHMQVVNAGCELLDIVGTGGDGFKTVNISTAASILAAACGAKVAKHGNRSVSSACGSADLLEAYGIPIELNAHQVEASIKELGIGFCYAPLFHPALAKLRSIRNALKIPTIFNLIGPLLNPAQASYYLLGTANPGTLLLLAEVLVKLNIKHALVVHSAGLDEVSLIAPTKVIEINAKGMTSWIMDPKEYGFEYGSLEDIQGDTAQFNVERLTHVFAGEPSALADTIILNAGVALYAANQTPTIREGVLLAREKLQSHAAEQLLEKWKSFRPH